MKTLDRLGIRRNIPPHNKGHILKKKGKKKKANIILSGDRIERFFLLGQEQDKDAYSHYSYSVYEWKS